MWTLLGSWIFVCVVVGVAGVALFAVLRGRSKTALAVTTGAFLVATLALVSLLVSPTTVDGGVGCGATIDSTRTVALDRMTGDDLAAAGAEDYSDECREAARKRYGIVLGIYILALAGLGGITGSRSRS